MTLLINILFIYISDADGCNDIDDDNKEIGNKKKKKSSNQISKEKNINEADAEIAKTVMELHSKWYCNKHERSCYTDSIRHITLTTNHLSTWARSIVS